VDGFESNASGSPESGLLVRGDAGRLTEKRQADVLLRRVTWLAQTPPKFQDQLLTRADLLRLKKGDLLYDVGDDATGLFGVAEGHVEVHAPRAGVDATLSFVGGPGFWFGDIAALTGQPRRVGIVARTDCRLLRVPRAQIVRLTEADPEVWRSFSLLLARNYAKAMGIIHALKQSDPARRVAAMLVVVVEDNAPGVTTAPASQWDIGELAHLGRSKVNASLKALESRGLIQRRYRSIDVVDAAGLRIFVHEPGALGAPSRPLTKGRS
jgi:CRP/FNR family cyclic AMP-dependent transcriptional regulator